MRHYFITEVEGTYGTYELLWKILPEATGLGFEGQGDIELIEIKDFAGNIIDSEGYLEFDLDSEFQRAFELFHEERD